MTTTKKYDYLNRLRSIRSVPSSTASLPFSFAYQCNAANQRTRTTLQEDSFWRYEYDDLGQVTSGKKYWSDGTPVAGQQFEYAFDDIGNRNSTKSGGDQYGMNLRQVNYTNNVLNQITSRTTDVFFDFFGIADPTSLVDVNGNTNIYRRGPYFWSTVELGFEDAFNTSASATKGGTTTMESRNIFVPSNPEVYQYDLDGNVTQDGRWTYKWNAENRLTEMERYTGFESPAKLVFDYDHQGRRIRKTVTSGASTLEKTVFVYDGWNLLAELNATNNAVVRSYVWGLDLSGTLQGAGGVGGLIAVKDATEGTHFAAFDGNGNVAGLVSASTGATTAIYEYDPFLRPLRKSGLMAERNPFQASTEYFDAESGYLYYGYRYYNPSTGRWLNRDPIGERGGKNLYIFSGNDAVDFFDVLGLAWKIERKGRDRAHAKPESGDTVEDLAKLIRFDNKDYRMWLKPVGPSRMPGSATEPINGCAEFTRPNTVFVDIGPRIRDPWYLRYVDKINVTFTFLSAMARGTGDLYESKGFNVVRTEQATGTDIRNHLGSPNIHAYVFAGHGDSGAINSNYPSNVARRGKFFGSINNYTALLAIMLGVDELVFIWTPGTNE